MLFKPNKRDFRMISEKVQEEFRLNICLFGFDCFALRNH